MARSTVFPLLFALLYFSSPIHSAKILIYNPLFGQSHVNFVNALADVLKEEGHDLVCLISSLSIAFADNSSTGDNTNDQIGGHEIRQSHSRRLCSNSANIVM